MTEDFVAQLPYRGWSLVLSMQQNDMFVLGMSDDEYNDAMRCGDYAKLSKHLYRVQKLTKGDYFFRHHLETSVDDKYNGEKNEMLSKSMGKLVRVSLSSLKAQNPRKVQISVVGKIVEK